jgi:hypothetical protein
MFSKIIADRSVERDPTRMSKETGVMVFNATFNDISYIVPVSFLVEETEVPGENHRPATSH